MKKGFTLIELLMTLGIVSILLVVLTQVFGSIITLRLKTDFTSGIAQDSRYLLNILENDLIQAETISSPAVNTTSSSLIMQVQGQTISYSFYDNQIIRDTAGISLPITSSAIVSDFSINRPNDLGGIPHLTISFTLTTPATSDTPAQSRTYQSTYTLRTR